jgi:hypothetical protein
MEPMPLSQPCHPEAIARELAPWLDDLESRIDADDEQRLLDEWKSFADGRAAGDVFRPTWRAGRQAGIAWPEIRLHEALLSPRDMVYHQLRGVSGTFSGGNGNLACVRANYGTGILPSLFGVRSLLMDPATGTLPGTMPLGRAAMPALVAAGVPALESGLWPLVRSVGLAFVACTAGRPKLARHLHIYHPDLQGPMDVLELLWGSECFTSFVDEPELVHDVLRVVTDAYRAVLRDWDAVVPDRDPGYCAHWGMLHRGHILLRDDSAMNLSPRLFDRYITPYNSELLRDFGGGAIHACGKVDHFLERATALPGLHAFNFGQPHLNDPRRIRAGTVERGVQVIGMLPDAWKAIGGAGRGLVHCW